MIGKVVALLYVGYGGIGLEVEGFVVVGHAIVISAAGGLVEGAYVFETHAFLMTRQRL